MAAAVSGESKGRCCSNLCQLRPWRLPCWETVIHSIPIVGSITSSIAWRRRSCQVLSPVSSPVRRHSPAVTRGNDSPVCLSPNSERGAKLLGDDSSDEDEELAAEEPTKLPQMNKTSNENLLVTQKLNTAAIFWLNTVITAIALTATLYTLRHFNRI
jgi:hypothetical protein